MTNAAKEAEQKKRLEKAKAMRYRKAICKELNIETIQNSLYEMMESCTDVQYSVRDDEYLYELIGDSDDLYEFQTQFSALSADVESLFNDLQESDDVTEAFDYFLGAFGSRTNELMGYDIVEQDYWGLESDWEIQAAIEENEKRLMRLTKNELIYLARKCFTVAFSYIGIRHRYDNLSNSIEIIKGRNLGCIQAIKDLEEAYERAWEAGFVWNSKEVKRFDEILKSLPDEIWLQ